jgi:hypothetical protein
MDLRRERFRTGDLPHRGRPTRGASPDDPVTWIGDCATGKYWTTDAWRRQASLQVSTAFRA